MEKKRLALVKALNFLCFDEKSVSQFAYQLGLFFITKLSRNDLKLASVMWVYQTLDELGFEFSIFLMREEVATGQLLEAIERLQKLDFLYADRADPTRDEVALGVRDKSHWVLILPIELLSDFQIQIDEQLPYNQ